MSASYAAVEALLQRGAKEGVFSGAVLRVEGLRGTGALLELAVGRVSSLPSGPAMQPSTLFDIASLTKLFSATLSLRLVAAEVLELDVDVSHVLAPQGQQLRGVTLRNLLEHRSGLPAWRPYFESSVPVREAALLEPLEAPPGSRHCYSDVGFLVLMELLERASGRSFRELMEQEVLVPLGLVEVGYRPVNGGESAALQRIATGRFAATEQCPYRGLLCGEVHDDNTWAMGGVAAHAGLFASAEQVAAFARAWWQAPELSFLPAELRDQAWSGSAAGGHILGWDTVSSGTSSAGQQLSRRSHGHLGFTGTSLWVDPERAIAVVLLSNRVHPERGNGAAIRRFRPQLHDAVAEFVDRMQ